MNEIEKKEEYTLIPKDDFDFLVWFDEQEKRAKVIRERVRESGGEFLEKNKKYSYKQERDGVTVHIYKTKPYKKKEIDIKALKEQGLYDDFAREKWVQGSVRIQVEYDNRVPE